MLVVHNYRDVINYAVMRYLDQENNFIYVDNKIYIDIRSNSVKKRLQYNIIDCLLDHYTYNKENILLNTCKPLNNWREPLPNDIITDQYNYKYNISDDSVYVDLNLFNRFLDNLFKKIPKIIDAEYQQDENDARLLINKKKQFTLIEFQNIDITDILSIFKNHYQDLSITILNNTIFNYNIIEDNNDVVYMHGGDINITLLEQIRLTLIEKGIL